MTIYTVVGSNGSSEWASKSFYDLGLADKFIRACVYTVNRSPNIEFFLERTPDPIIKNRTSPYSIKLNHITYSLNENELVIDDFMKQVMVPDLC